jgi:hypothetical protein
VPTLVKPEQQQRPSAPTFEIAWQKLSDFAGEKRTQYRAHQAGCAGVLIRNRSFRTIDVRQSALSGQSNRTRVCPLLDQSGQKWILACNGLSANDPTATSVAHCGNRFDAGFSPYQSARLSR